MGEVTRSPVAVIGGGWVGALVAVTLSRGGMSVCRIAEERDGATTRVSTTPAATFLSELVARFTQVPEIAILKSAETVSDKISARAALSEGVTARLAPNAGRDGAPGVLHFAFPGEHAEWTVPSDDLDHWAEMVARSYGCVDCDRSPDPDGHGYPEGLIIDLRTPVGSFPGAGTGRRRGADDTAGWVYGPGVVEHPGGHVVERPRGAVQLDDFGSDDVLCVGPLLDVVPVTEGRVLERGLQVVLICVAALADPENSDLDWARAQIARLRDDDMRVVRSLTEEGSTYVLWSARMRVWFLKTLVEALAIKRWASTGVVPEDAAGWRRAVSRIVSKASPSDVRAVHEVAFRPLGASERPGVRGAAILAGLRATSLPPIFGFAELTDTRYELGIIDRLRTVTWAVFDAPPAMREILLSYGSRSENWVHGWSSR